MVLCGVALVVIVFVAPLAFAPDVSAVCARKLVGVRTTPGAHFNVDTLASLNPVAVSRQRGRRTGASSQLVHTERHKG
jgi:hypothetical protein